MSFRRFTGLIAFGLGLLGVVACVAGAYAIALLAARLHQASESVFSAVDRGLNATKERIGVVKQRMEQAKITTSDVNQKVLDWTSKEAKDRIAKQLEIESRAEKLAMHLQTADSWLETLAESIRGLQGVNALGQSLGASTDAASLNEILEAIESIRSRLQQEEQSINNIGELAVGKEDETNRLAQITKLLGRTLATISELHIRLENTRTRLGALRVEITEIKARTDKRITWGAIACWTILVWVAAGEIALCFCGWKAISARSSN